MEEVKHLERFEVENFKCFSKLILEDIGQFNIFLGENNVGKTSLLESLTVSDDSHSQYIYRLFSILQYRGIFSLHPSTFDIEILDFFTSKSNPDKPINYQLYYTKKNNINISFSNVSVDTLTTEQKQKINSILKFDKKSNKLYKYTINQNDNYDFYSNTIGINSAYFPYIPVNLGYNNDLIEYYATTISLSKEIKNSFINKIKLFIPDIENIELSINSISGGNIISIWIKSLNTPIMLPLFGEGSIKLFRILGEIILCKNNRLMIDEIDTGIHYSKFKAYWKTILLGANENNVQLFSTTHSLECLKYFTQALEDEDMQAFRDKARIYTLIKNREGNIEAIPHRFEQFEHAINNEIEIRK